MRVTSSAGVIPPIDGKAVQLDHDCTRTLVKDLHKAQPVLYWADLLISSSIGWTAFTALVAHRTVDVLSASLLVVSVLALYRSLCFIHELSHQTDRTLPGFEGAFNLLVGFPLLLPSLTYVGMHQSHHRIDLYGTEADPEYLPFSRSWRMTVLFTAESLAMPIALMLRFLILAPFGLLIPRFQRWLITYASSLTMNPKFRRAISPELERRVRLQSIYLLALWSVPVMLSLTGKLPLRWLACWVAVQGLVSLINTLRTLGAHQYESSGAPMDRLGQLEDSIDTPGAFWTELWAPVGLRYHALHHYYPGIPYHNLPAAYGRILSCVSASDAYQKMSSKGLTHSLAALLERGRRGSGPL